MAEPPEASRPAGEPGGLGPAGEPAGRRPPVPPGSAEEALRRLEQRLDRASEAAERLMAQAAEAAAAGAGAAGGAGTSGGAGASGGAAEADDAGAGAGDPVKPPPSGWQIPEDGAVPPDLDPLVTLVQAVRDLIPPELQRRLVAALRELLLALRAVIDWYLERMERQREQAADLEDIPIL
jgi:hypothetical protein